MHSDNFHRLAKSLLDSGEVSSLDEAMDVFGGYGVRVRLPASLASDPAAQVIALTVINAASRSFQGNVVLEGDDTELIVRGFEETHLHGFMRWAGVKETVGPSARSWPTISIGDAPASGAIHTWASGWRFGLGSPPARQPMFVAACIAAGGLAVSEAFSVLRKDNPYAGRRSVSLSLWDPVHGGIEYGCQIAPPQQALWLIGLGHLGQAYSWGLGFMEPGEAPLVLQDVDTITASTVSTSMLSTPADVGNRKTRVVSRWLEARGYNTAIVERRFDGNQRIAPSEPSVALFGVDNPAARRVMEGCGFRTIIDAGLGSGYKDFRAIRMRTFPGPSLAAALWASSADTAPETLSAAYQQMLRDGADPCGVTTLATRAVGAPFVGCVAAGYSLAERIRRQLGGPGIGFLDLNLRNPSMLVAG